jgi:hypothetical protein
MHKSKSDLCSMIHFLEDYKGHDSFVELMEMKKYELADMIIKLLDKNEQWMDAQEIGYQHGLEYKPNKNPFDSDTQSFQEYDKGYEKGWNKVNEK